MQDKKVALVHDWLVSYRGGEKVLEALSELYPDAPIYTLFYNPKKIPAFLRNKQIIYPRRLNKFRWLRKLMLPFLPSQIESLEIRGFDLVISTSSCVAKGIILDPQTKHLCYMHSPMRYIWDQRQNYFARFSKIPIVSTVLHFLLARLRVWDFISAQRVDVFLANSNFVAKRIQNFYRRDSFVVHPPVDVGKFSERRSIQTKRQDFYLAAVAFVPYKRFDLVISAFNKSGKKLVIAGDGPLREKLRSQAYQNIRFVISPPDEELISLMQQAKAFIFPMVEDFGIVGVEALAAGLPVIALKKGGVLDFIEEGRNGIYFLEQTPESLNDSVERFETITFDHELIRQSAERFSKFEFHKKIRAEVLRLLSRET